MSCKYDYQIDLTEKTSHSLLLKRITPGSQILELGSATGYMTRYLKEELGCTVTCVEIDAMAAAKGSIYSAKMIVADLDLMEWNKELQGKSFDHVVIADVLEHLNDPWQVVRVAVQFLKPQATLLISVPNIGHSSILMELLEGRFDYRPTGLLDDTHIRFFTRKSLLDLLDRAGMCPIELMGTEIEPEDTEFGQSYGSKTAPLARILKDREDAHIYQYVVVAKRQEEVADHVYPRHLTIESSSKSKDFLQIYWSDWGFSESKSVTVPLGRDQQEFVDHKIVLPESVGENGGLRLDPTNFPAFVEIRDIELKTWDKHGPGQLVSQWSAETGYSNINLSQGMIRISDVASLKLLCPNDDPQVTLSEVPRLKEQSVLCFKMRVSRDLQQAALGEVVAQQANIIELRQFLENRMADDHEMNSVLKRSYEEHDNRVAEIKELNSALARSQEELGRRVTDIDELKNALNKSQLELANQATDIDELNAIIESSQEELKQRRAKVADYEQQLKEIKSSTVWRTTSKLMRIACWSRKQIKLGRDLLRGGYKQRLIPLDNIIPLADKGPSYWQAVGEDPKFLLSGPFPHGWSEIRFKAASPLPLKVRIYFDRGRGFNETESLALEVVCGENIQDYRVIVLVGYDIKQVRLDPGEEEGTFAIDSCKIARVTRLGILLRAFGLFFQRQGYSGHSMKLWATQIGSALKRGGPKGLWRWAKNLINPQEDYNLWLKYHTLTEARKEILQTQCSELALKPVISILVPVYNVDERWLRCCLDSVREQVYPHWELCIADDASTDPRVQKTLKEYAAKDARIKIVYREKNGHISAASNSALELATGEYIGLLDHDDCLTADALYENALLINQHPEAVMIYSDEDKISEDGVRHSPYFKPDWSPDNLLAQMYTCHFGVYKTSVVRELGGFRRGFEGSQDHDLALRVSETTNKIYHIPRVLYHWRTVAESTAASVGAKSYATIAGLKAVGEALDRRGEGGWAESLEHYPYYRVHYPVKGDPLISIIIPTRDMARLLGKCLETIFNKTTYAHYEVLIVDNGSVKLETKQLFAKWQQLEPQRFRVIHLDMPFNYSRLNNQAVQQAKGELVVLLNNDMEIITPSWLEEMAGQAIRPSIGAVGAKLLYADQTIQHSGVTLGIGGVGGHSYRGYDSEEPGYFGRLVIVANYAAVTGACLMVKRELFDQVGGLEEELTVAFNDVDFCLKLWAKGYYNVVLPQVKLYHFESKSRGYEDTPEKMQRFLGEVTYMKKHWQNCLERDPFYNPNLTLDKEDYAIDFLRWQSLQ
ncbi:MAG: glycosyltransferase [Desulfitobacterium sp.]